MTQRVPSFSFMQEVRFLMKRYSAEHAIIGVYSAENGFEYFENPCDCWFYGSDKAFDLECIMMADRGFKAIVAIHKV